jgi:hypothetical protein
MGLCSWSGCRCVGRERMTRPLISIPTTGHRTPQFFKDPRDCGLIGGLVQIVLARLMYVKVGTRVEYYEDIVPTPKQRVGLHPLISSEKLRILRDGGMQIIYPFFTVDAFKQSIRSLHETIMTQGNRPRNRKHITLNTSCTRTSPSLQKKGRPPRGRYLGRSVETRAPIRAGTPSLQK